MQKILLGPKEREWKGKRREMVEAVVRQSIGRTGKGGIGREGMTRRERNLFGLSISKQFVSYESQEATFPS